MSKYEIMIEDGNDADEAITAEELTDLAFGMFTIFAGQKIAESGRQLYTEIDKESILPELKSLVEEFSKLYPELAEPLLMFGDAEDILQFYRSGEGIVPTRTSHMFWIQQNAPDAEYDACSREEAGKWLLFLPPAEADDAWIKIRDATAAGELGIGAKVSTSHDNSDSRDDRKVIYVFTKNWDDEADVMRVREVLKTLGFTDRIGYKRNLDTYAGEYREKGKRVTYYSV